MADAERYMRVREFAERLQISESKVFKLLSDNRVKAVRIDRSLRIAESELTRFIDSLQPDEAA